MVSRPANRVVSRPATCHNVIAGDSTNPIPEGAENGFSGCAGNASRPRNKLRTRSPFSVWFGAGFELSGLNSG
ncbi:hypothetical protein VRM95_004648 [Salmonella enterica]|nr:hypothetical protein [Salmonella enterica]EMD5642871.1 hypothetical protein [Salmonella enterica]